MASAASVREQLHPSIDIITGAKTSMQAKIDFINKKCVIYKLRCKISELSANGKKTDGITYLKLCRPSIHEKSIYYYMMDSVECSEFNKVSCINIWFV